MASSSDEFIILSGGVFAKTISGFRKYIPLTTESNTVGSLKQQIEKEFSNSSEVGKINDFDLRRRKHILDTDAILTDHFDITSKSEEIEVVKKKRHFYGTYVDEITANLIQNKYNKIAIKIFVAFLWSFIIAGCAQVSFTLFQSQVPYSLQNFALFVGSFLLGQYVTLSFVFYLIEGGIGLPFFAGQASGWEVLTGPTSGYIWGFLIAAFVVGSLCRLGWDRKILWWLAAVLIGNACIFFLGVFVLTLIINDFETAIVNGFLIFLPGEILKLLVVSVLMPLAWASLSAFTNYKNGTSQSLKEFGKSFFSIH